MVVIASRIDIVFTLPPLLFDLAYDSDCSVSKITNFCHSRTHVEDNESQRR